MDLDVCTPADDEPSCSSSEPETTAGVTQPTGWTPCTAQPSASPIAPQPPIARERPFQGPLSSAASRWWQALSDEELELQPSVDLVEIFCGEDRPGDMRDATMAAGGSALGVDTCLAGADHDVSDDVVYSALCRLIAARKVRHLWLGVVCSSLSQLWLKKGRPRLRSRRQPDGIWPMPYQWIGYIRRANILIERAAYLAYLQWTHGGTYYIENPADVGFWASPHFQWSKRAAVSLWIVSYIRTLVAATDPVWGTTALCGWHGPFRKLTTVCAAGPDAAFVISITEVQCTCISHALVADGIDSRGRQLSRLAGQYPPLFCGFFGHNFTRAQPWHAKVAAAWTPMAAQLIDIVEKQRPPPVLPRPATEPEAILQQASLTHVTSLRWRSAHLAIPSHWPEHEDVTGQLYQATRSAPLQYISRRRSEAEAHSVLATRAMPKPITTPASEPKLRYSHVQWPAGCPPRPIHISLLYFEGVYDSILASIERVRRSCDAGRQSGIVPKDPSQVFRAEECQPEWAREIDWDTSDPDDCVPLQPNIEEPPAQGLQPAFFTAWAAKLNWADKQMISLVSCTGAEDGSTCTRATIISGHHRGLRQNFVSARTCTHIHACA